jgi:hypothetical protein
MKKIALVMSVAMLFSGVAFAKGTFVKGAKCSACHVGSPPKKEYNETAKKMLEKYKTDECQNCHGAATEDKPMSTKPQAEPEASAGEK